MQFLNLFSWPSWVLFELSHENPVLSSVLSEALLCLLCALGSMSYNNSRDWSCNRSNTSALLTQINSLSVSRFLCICECNSMLFIGSFGLLLKNGVYAFVEIITCHIIIDDSNSVSEDNFLIFRVNVPDLGQFTLLLGDLYLMLTILAWFWSLLIRDDWSDWFFKPWENGLLRSWFSRDAFFCFLLLLEICLWVAIFVVKGDLVIQRCIHELLK